MSPQLPEKFKVYFWDTDFYAVDLQRDKWFVIEKIINNGDLEAAKWLFKTYPVSVIIHILRENYNISNHAANLWAPMLNIPIQNCACSRRPSHLRVFDW
jgi:hypothetical protein